jgi:hypothetical protein
VIVTLVEELRSEVIVTLFERVMVRGDCYSC